MISAFLATASMPMSAPSTSECNALRYFYPGSTARNGNLVFLPPGVAYLTGEDAGALLELDGVDMGRWRARYQHVELEGWAVVDDDTPLEFRADRKTLDISLERRADPPARVPPQGDVIQGLENVDVAHIANQADGARDGYFGVGIVGGKNEANQGTLWRSAYQLGAAFTYTVGARFEKSSADTTKTWTNLPMYSHSDWNAFAANTPYDAVWVAVEMGGTPLRAFTHPDRAVYVLGSEDNGLPSSVLRACAHTVELPATAGRNASYNVAVSGALVMYDRLMKRRRVGDEMGGGVDEARSLRGGRVGVDSAKPSRGGT
jgi:tRNA(Leu) C34 or U34 (ribose-2'-O)-methylase TrmL